MEISNDDVLGLKNWIAELGSPDSGIIVSPKQAEQYPDEKFFCPDCDCLDKQRRLFLKHSKNNRPFFSHYKNCDHPIAAETLLHKLAIRWFQNKKEFEAPSGQPLNQKISQQVLKLNPEKTSMEFRRYVTIIPDVHLFTVDDSEIAVEIFVTNDVSDEKRKIIEEFNLPTLRVDLSDFYRENLHSCRTDPDFIIGNLDSLMTNINLKSWLHPSEVEKLNDKNEQERQASGTGCLLFFIVVGIVIAIGFSNQSVFVNLFFR